MIFFFLLLTTCFSIGLGRPTESDESLWLKLKNFQNVTGISEDTMQSIWQKSSASKSGRKLIRRPRDAEQGTY